MSSNRDAIGAVTNILEDVALLISKVSAGRDPDDDFVWDLMKRLSRLRARALRVERLHRTGRTRTSIGASPVHPAVEHFLCSAPTNPDRVPADC